MKLGKTACAFATARATPPGPRAKVPRHCPGWRAFFYAGARTLLVSHWEVGSDAAVRLTTRTFEELKAHSEIGRAEAFRRSMKALIEKGSLVDGHRSQWAPFVVVGEGAAAR